MPKSYRANEFSQARNYITYIANDLYPGLLGDRNNWIYVSEFEYECVDDDGSDPEKLCGWMFKKPIIIDGKNYIVGFANYYRTPERYIEAKEGVDQAFESLMQHRDFEDCCNSFLQEWVFGKKKIPHVNGGNV